jgi:cellulose synthase/poly-beta-1,6-N-acetylglucosamine synthase-like glycosyltransferase
VLYDAEDRPDPGQLEEAWQRFRRDGNRLACLQAPLVIGNGARSWLSAHFALEYAALFRGFLPWLARHHLPLPLGGTSNHFRREALVSVGAWDSHNVTEDADLGVRFCRDGYRIGTIGAPTAEDAPELWPVWLKQRSRWLKGWMQTWLVHMRQPLRLWRGLGPLGFLTFQILFVGMVGSALAHPLCFLFCSWTTTSWVLFGFPGLLACGLLTADLVILVLGIGSYVLLASRGLEAEHRSLARHLATVPFYWLLISIAALRAFCLLIKAPHVWEKTPHGRAATLRHGGALSPS